TVVIPASLPFLFIIRERKCIAKLGTFVLSKQPYRRHRRSRFAGAPINFRPRHGARGERPSSFSLFRIRCSVCDSSSVVRSTSTGTGTGTSIETAVVRCVHHCVGPNVPVTVIFILLFLVLSARIGQDIVAAVGTTALNLDNNIRRFSRFSC
ncbi:unnamed protein product, partial [Ectocarpus sp. 8 AP-2014]